MPHWELPRNLVYTVEHSVLGSAQRHWLASLPGIVDELALRWSLEQVGQPFQPGGAASWVAAARTTGGECVVLKVGWRHDEALHEADGLRAWDGEGAVRLLEASAFGHTSALLLEACQPGTTLSEVLPEPEQDTVVSSCYRGSGSVLDCLAERHHAPGARATPCRCITRCRTRSELRQP